MDRRQVMQAIALAAPFTAPATALEIAQGSPYLGNPAAEAISRRPVTADFSNVLWENPYKSILYPFTPDTVVSTQALAGNIRRCYLLIQNKGPGNLFVNFGAAADQLNSVMLVPGQVYELIGGLEGGAYVMRDSVWVLTDLLGTVGVVIDGFPVPVSNARRPV